MVEQLKNIRTEEAYKLLKKYYLDYGMTVITDRSLPDVRDGLKPVQRRVLYTMYQYLKLFPDKSYKKCARIVGEVLGKLHPHGDSSVYGALVRMGQYFSLRYPLIDPHGNYGKIDGSTPAAMRYTEGKLSHFGLEVLRDLNKNTVDFIPNFDGEEQEPLILPSRIPNILVNGNMGIAVGFSTNIPTHNLTDTINEILYQIDNPECTIEELVNILKAPDFPTGGTIINPKDMLNMYKNGEGKITVRGKYHIKDNSIIFTEIPFGVDINTTNIVDNLRHCAFGYNKKKKDKKGKTIIETIPPTIKNIKEIKDETDEIDGIHIEIVVDKKENINKVLKQIFDKKILQNNFSALFNVVKGKKLLQKMNLKQINKEYIDYQTSILLRRSKYELDKLLLKKEIIDGYCKILKDVDKTVNIIKNSENEKEAKQKIIKEYDLTERQGNEITKLRLTRITHMGIEEYIDELNNINIRVDELNDILNNESSLIELLKKELIEIRDRFSKNDKRKTELLYEDSLDKVEINNVEDKNVSILVTEQGYIKKFLKQSDNHKLKDGDNIIQEFKCNNRDTLFFFTDTGVRIKLPVNDLEEKKPTQLGEYIPTLLSDKLNNGEQIIKVISVPQNPKGFIINIYENGKVSKINIDAYMSANTRLQNSYNMDSKLIDLKYVEKDVDILLISSDSKSLIVNTSQINPKSSKKSQGTTAIKLNEGCKLLLGTIDISKEFRFTLTTDKITKEFRLDDIAPTNKPNEERDLYTYIQGRCGGKGNKLMNKELLSAEINKIN